MRSQFYLPWCNYPVCNWKCSHSSSKVSAIPELLKSPSPNLPVRYKGNSSMSIVKFKNQGTCSPDTIKLDNIPVPKGRNRIGIGPKWDQNSAGQTLPPVAPVLHSGHVVARQEFKESGQPLSCGFASCSPHGLTPGLALLGPTSFLGRCSTFTTSLTFWDLHYSFSFTPTASHSATSGAPGRHCSSVTWCLASQAFLWNLEGSFHDPIMLVVCVPVKLHHAYNAIS